MYHLKLQAAACAQAKCAFPHNNPTKCALLTSPTCHGVHDWGPGRLERGPAPKLGDAHIPNPINQHKHDCLARSGVRIGHGGPAAAMRSPRKGMRRVGPTHAMRIAWRLMKCANDAGGASLRWRQCGRHDLRSRLAESLVASYWITLDLTHPFLDPRHMRLPFHLPCLACEANTDAISLL